MKKYIAVSLLLSTVMIGAGASKGLAAEPKAAKQCARSTHSNTTKKAHLAMHTAPSPRTPSSLLQKNPAWQKLQELRLRKIARRNPTSQTGSSSPQTSSSSAPSTPTPSLPPSTGSADAQKQRVIELVNAERAKANLPPLKAQSQLTNAAQGHADDMRQKQYFDHVNKEGLSPTQRMRAAGYNGSYYGENIARGQKSPEQVMNDWMNSPGHKKNILSPNFDDIGIGVSGNYWVQNFGRTRAQ